MVHHLLRDDREERPEHVSFRLPHLCTDQRSTSHLQLLYDTLFNIFVYFQNLYENPPPPPTHTR